MPQQRSSNPGNSFLGWLAANSKTFVLLLVVLGISVGVTALYIERQQKVDAAARDALFEAKEDLDAELKAVAPPEEPTPPADQDKSKDKKPPAPPAKPSGEFKKLDVDKTFPKTIVALKKVHDQFPGTDSALQADLMMGNLYMDHGSSSQALLHYSDAVTAAGKPLERAGALASLAEAQESSGQCGEAVKTIERALNQGIAALKGDLLVTQARCYETLKESGMAKSIYNRIVTELPGTPFSKLAEIYRAQIK